MDNLFITNGFTYNNVGATKYRDISSLNLLSGKPNFDTFETSKTFEQYMSSAIESKNKKSGNGRLTDDKSSMMSL